MKKVRLLMGVLALVVLAAVIIACTKEKEKEVAQNISEMEVVSIEDDMSAYLKQFKEKMQMVSKGNETLSMEDARWHLEAVLNYTYGDAGYQTSEIQRDTFCCNLLVQGEEIALAQLNEAFVLLSQNVENAYADCNLAEKSILSIQVLFDNNNKKDDDVVITGVLTTRGLGIMDWLPWFDSTDYWSDYSITYNGQTWGNGKCGPYSGQYPNSGAPHELTIMANLRIPLYGCQRGYRMFLTDISPVEIYPEDDLFLMDNNSPCGYMIYYNSNDPYDPSHNPSHCIPPEDMNYYLDKFDEIMLYFQPNGKVPVGATYMYDVLTSIPGAAMHRLDIDYAIIHCELVGCDE